MKLFLISAGMIVSSLAIAQNSTPPQKDENPTAAEPGSDKTPEKTPEKEDPSTPASTLEQKKEIPSESKSIKDSKKPIDKIPEDKLDTKKQNQEVNQGGKEIPADEPTHSPYGASYSFGLARINEGSLNLNSSGFARIEVHRKMSQKLLNYERLEIGLSYSGADIGGNMGKNGAFDGAVNFYGGRLSAYTRPQGRWFYQYTAGFDLAKIKKIPAFNFISGKTAVTYTPVLTVGGAAHFYLMKGLAIGPRLDLALGGVSGWNFGFQARLAY